jgi:hypothetical protein
LTVAQENNLKHRATWDMRIQLNKRILKPQETACNVSNMTEIMVSPVRVRVPPLLFMVVIALAGAPAVQIFRMLLQQL